jgi:hypothetical protein
VPTYLGIMPFSRKAKGRETIMLSGVMPNLAAPFIEKTKLMVMNSFPAEEHKTSK